ncbi:MAG TPA: hypothetical protein VGP76_11410 [Planctomycetaceae bacterium]|jgi:cytochrome c oxidase subunit IV|nr:hypothetical protein [Planctomycetaceae bacterium]
MAILRNGNLRNAGLAGAVMVQIAAWFSVLYCLYYVVPGYKFVVRDLNVANVSATFPKLAAVSDFVVVYGRSDALFPWLLAALLLALAGLNLICLKTMKRERGRLLWSGIMLLVPLCILVFQVSCLAGVRRLIINQHPEVLDYRLPWISR